MSETSEAYDAAESPVAANLGASVPKTGTGPSAQTEDAVRDAYEEALLLLARAEADVDQLRAQLAAARSEIDRLRHAIRDQTAGQE